MDLPRAYRVAHLTIAPSVVLAPMEGVTDLSFRRLIRRIGGPGLTVTEFIASSGLSGGGLKVLQMAEIDPDERPVAIQIYGRDPQVMADAARVVEDLGASLCDINMGCPSKRVCQNSGGSSLMREPELVRRIVAAVVAAVRIPVTVKMRSGFDHTSRNAPEIAAICEGEGAAAVTVHWRTRADRYGGERAVDRIAATRARLRIPVLGNGDIVDVPSAVAMFQDTGCDGVMVGRGAIRDPWLLLRIARHLEGLPQPVVDTDERERVALAYADELAGRFRRLEGALGRMKMFMNHFSRQFPYPDALRTRFLRSHTWEAGLAVLAEHLDRTRRAEAGEASAWAGYELPSAPPEADPLEAAAAC